MSPNPSIAAYGFTAVPRSVTALLSLSTASADSPAVPITISSIPIPSSPLAIKVQEYAQKELAVETFNHSMRVYYYGIRFSSFCPSFHSSPHTTTTTTTTLPPKERNEKNRTKNPEPKKAE